MLLSDAPRPARRLPQRVERIPGLVKVERWKAKKIEPCFHQLRMTNYHFDAVFELLAARIADRHYVYLRAALFAVVAVEERAKIVPIIAQEIVEDLEAALEQGV